MTQTLKELPTDFPHQPPEGYTYYVEEHKTNIVGIWIRNHARYSYTNKPIVSIWGFYSSKTGKYYAPINSKKVGKIVDIADTRPYSSMQLTLKGLEAFFV